MRIVINIVDPAMHNYAGHFADINIRVARLLAARGFDVMLYVHQRFISKNPELRIQPHFSLNPYSLKKRISLLRFFNGSLKTQELAAASFSREMSSVRGAALTLLPSAFPYQIVALASSKKSLGKTVFCIHGPPDESGTQGRENWRQALKAIAARPEVFSIGVFEPELLLPFERLQGHEKQRIELFPIPHDGFRGGVKPPVLSLAGLIGHQRETKGLANLQVTVDTLLKCGLNVLLQDSSELTKHALAPSTKLRVLGYVENMGNLFQNLDAVVLNYDADYYRYRGSGIAWESIASGVPVVAPAGTSISRLLRDYSCGATFVSGDLQSLERAILQMKHNFPEHLAKSSFASMRYLSSHGTAKFVDQILLPF